MSQTGLVNQKVKRKKRRIKNNIPAKASLRIATKWLKK